MTRSFGLDALSALEELKNTVERFRAEILNEGLARDIAGKAWHLCDHVFKAIGPDSQFAKLVDIQNHVRNCCPELTYLQDICIETKHAEISRYEPRIDQTNHHKGGFSPYDFDSVDFDTSRLEIKTSRLSNHPVYRCR